jgi:hypothetical protein
VHLGLPPPALIKPRPLWTGKQLISAVVEHFADGRPPLTFSSGSKVGVLLYSRPADVPPQDFVVPALIPTASCCCNP